MKKTRFRQCVSLMLTLAMALSFALTASAAESDGLCDHHPSHTADCGFEATGECGHICSTETGCITVPCRHTHDESCYNDIGKLDCKHKCSQDKLCQVPILKCLHTAHEDCGYSEGADCDFAVNGCPLCKMVELTAEDVRLPNGTEYTHTGSEIKPAVIVSLNQTVLTQDEHYTVTYANNIEVGTGTVIVSGVKEAGYNGSVVLPFTIVAAQTPETPSEPSQPTEPETPSEPSRPTEPETPSEPSRPTEPETPSEPSQPTEPSEPEEETKPDYRILKGNGAKWRKDSKTGLSFTVNADARDIQSIRINSKKLDREHYILGKDGIVTLKESWLQKQELGTYRITLEFEDGDASGRFLVAKATDPTNPQTGDAIGIWAGMLALSLTGAVALIALRKKML